ncbi:hypothetical protein [Archangium lansingense]|uniref:Uncharacterized protein n=1 Tax=Archangium lansingense TaxID=2995310 RepID=A0ABT3ZV23_9BACT|nr:hypothetical protein [Archangium lansinium]MCY1073151.1 hypothetical protein [Archangium lansinium]
MAVLLEDLARWGRAPEHWEKYPELLSAVTPAELQALVKRLNLGSEVIVITGDAALLKPQLEKAGYRVEREVRKAPAP